MDRGAWWATAHRVAKSWTWLKWLCIFDLRGEETCLSHAVRGRAKTRIQTSWHQPWVFSTGLHCLMTVVYADLAWLFGEGNGTPLQYSCLENPMDGGAWWAAVHGVAKSRTRLSDFPLTFHFHALEKEMATHSSVLAWRIPGMGEPGGLPSMGLHKVRHDWSYLAAAAAWLLAGRDAGGT